jgi:hypothetical protein
MLVHIFSIFITFYDVYDMNVATLLGLDTAIYMQPLIIQPGILSRFDITRILRDSANGV